MKYDVVIIEEPAGFLEMDRSSCGDHLSARGLPQLSGGGTL